VTVETIAELEGTIELRVIEPIYSSETSMGSSRVTILGVDVYGGAAVGRSVGTRHILLAGRAVMPDESGGQN
jgi:hypothetical protein